MQELLIIIAKKLFFFVKLLNVLCISVIIKKQKLYFIVRKHEAMLIRPRANINNYCAMVHFIQK